MIINNGRQPQSTDGDLTEESPLLAGQETDPPPNKISRLIEFQRAHLALPIVFFGFLAATIATTTSIQIIRILACHFWWTKHDPSRIPSHGNIPDELCDVQGVQKLFSLLFQVFTILDLCGGLVTSSPIGTLSAKFGRKPLFIIITAIATAAPLMLIAALQSISIGWIFASSVLTAVAGPRQLLLLSTMFVIDSTPNPAPVLSILEGSIYFGSAISYTLGGVITTRTGSLTYVFWIQSAIGGCILLYCIVAMPETFGPAERAARAAEVATERGRGMTRPSLRSRSSSLERVRNTAGTFARPFGLLWPRRDPITGKRNKRLLLLSISMVFALIGGTYAGSAWLVFVTNRFHATPVQTGYVLSIVSSIKTVYLLFILPAILKWGRRFYNQRWRSNPSANDPDSSSSHFDVHIISISWFVDSIAVLGVALAHRLEIATAAIMLVSIGSGANPSISTVVSASVGPLARGEALAAITLVRSVGEFLSPVLLGLVMNMTIDTRVPQAVFFVSTILLAFGAGIIMFIRDSDRYIPDRPYLDDPLHEDELRAD